MGKSSKDKRDAYYRLAKEQGWRARSAFKLLQLDEEFNLFEGVTRVVDLCAAPGSWSQVLSRVLIKGENFGRGRWLGQWREMQSLVQGEMRAKEEAKPGMTADRRDAEKVAAFRGDETADLLQKMHEIKVSDNIQTKTDTTTQTDDDPIPADTIQDTPTTCPPPTYPRKDIRIVAIDLQPMSPLEGITTIRADITHPSTIPMLLQALDPDTYDASSPDADSTPVDLILSDGAPDVTGLHDLDIYIQSQLLYSALNLSLRVLKPGGTFVAKIFRARDVDLLYAQLKCLFEMVVVAKPRASRASSLEAFVVCRGFAPGEGVRESVLGMGEGLDFSGRQRTKRRRWMREDGVEVLELGSEDEGEDEVDEEVDEEEKQARARRSANRWVAPFLACGDLDAPDADATYRLPEGYKHLDPVQPPTAPPYKKALEMRRAAGGAYGKTKKGK